MAITELKDSDWKEFIKADYAVIDCYGDGCVACVMLAPFYEAAADEMPGISFGRINTTYNPAIAEAYGVMALPTLLFFRKGEKVHELIGSVETDELRANIAKMLYE